MIGVSLREPPPIIWSLKLDLRERLESCLTLFLVSIFTTNDRSINILRPSSPTLHGSLQGVDGVDLCDDDASAKPTQSLDAAFTHVTVARNHGNFTSNHHIGGSLDAVDQTLPAAVQVVELTLQEKDRKHYCMLWNRMSQSF